jgi:hypothetical protein
VVVVVVVVVVIVLSLSLAGTSLEDHDPPPDQARLLEVPARFQLSQHVRVEWVGWG